MNQPGKRFKWVFATWFLLSFGVHAQIVQLIDPDGHSIGLTAAQIAKAPRTTVNVIDHDKPANFEGVSLSELLPVAGVPISSKMKGSSQLTQALLFEASDGYKVVFAMAEIDPAFTTREIILADTRDGKPLDMREGPFRVIAPGDKRAARWIRQVIAVKIVAVK
jgi:hypothetical protein